MRVRVHITNASARGLIVVPQRSQVSSPTFASRSTWLMRLYATYPIPRETRRANLASRRGRIEVENPPRLSRLFRRPGDSRARTKGRMFELVTVVTAPAILPNWFTDEEFVGCPSCGRHTALRTTAAAG